MPKFQIMAKSVIQNIRPTKNRRLAIPLSFPIIFGNFRKDRPIILHILRMNHFVTGVGSPNRVKTIHVLKYIYIL